MMSSIASDAMKRRSEIRMSWPSIGLAVSAHRVVSVLKGVMLVVVVVFGITSSASAEPYPSRPIRIIVPHTAGSPTDIIARLLAQSLSPRLGESVVIINRPGGGTVLGTREVVAAKPDGYTLLFVSSAVVINPAMKQLDYNPLKDLTPVASVSATPWVIVTSSTIPAKNYAEFVAYTKGHPGQTNFAATQGSAAILVATWFKQLSGADVFIVPYTGGVVALPDFLAGRMQLLIATPATSIGLIRSGKMNPILITSENRNAELPDVPTAREVGLPKLTLEFWAGMLAPAGTPMDIVTKLNGAINDVLQSPEMKQGMSALSLDAKIGTPQQFTSFMTKEVPLWSEIVQKTGVKF
jgi:tripartite-type tricarboxylate transporter receptor subunit TctC